MLSFDVIPEPTGGKLDLHLTSKTTGKSCTWTLDTRSRTASFGGGRSLREGGQPQHARDYAIEQLRGTDEPFSVRVLLLTDPKFGGTLVDVEIAGQRTMISHREGLDVDGFRMSVLGLDVKNVRVQDLDWE